MAYAALSSLFNAIKDVLESPPISITSSTREILLSVYNQPWLQNSTLSEGWCSEVVSASDEPIKIIIEEALRLQDAIEFSVSDQLLHQSKSCFSLNLDHLRQDFHHFSGLAKDMIGRIEELWEQRVGKLIEERVVGICAPLREEDDVSAEPTDHMVGLDDQFQELKNILSYVTHCNVRWISGMAGIGKTRIAQRLYHDPWMRANFKCWAFVRVGREYSTERLLRSINAQLNRGDEKMMNEGDYNLEDVRKSLKTTMDHKSFLIVLDDVWDDDFVHYIVDLQGMFFWTDKNILVTSRMDPEIVFRRYSLKLRFLNEEESWELLRRKVFGGEVCPRQLVEPGKKISRKCGGLPLLINAFAPLLLQKVDKDPERWNVIAEKPNSIVEEASLQISEVLLRSYYQLDEIYKLHFLYITAFPESYVVFFSTINNLWYVEGFGTLDAFDLLSKKNLVIAEHKSNLKFEGIKACRLHCAYWYVNKRIAKENRFLHIMNSYADGIGEEVKNHHRIAIQTNALLAIKEVFDHITSISSVRSMLCTGPYYQYQVPMCFEWKMLRVLDAVTIRFYEFPIEVVRLVLLKYLALTTNANLPPSISKLWNLQFLIVRQHWRIRQVVVESFVPVEVWCLQQLIHLEIKGRNLPEPPHPSVIFPNLVRLLDVGVESCTKGVLGNIPKLRKLRIQIELAPDAAENLRTCFSDVESFQCAVMNPTLSPTPLPLSVPILYGITKLSLSGFGYPWEEMNKLANLKNLRVMKLRSYAFRGEKWEVNKEMRFRMMKYLYIEDTDLVKWTGDACMALEVLKLKNCYKLREIPYVANGNLNVFARSKFELIDCNPLVETCAKKKNYAAQITATYSWKEKRHKSP